MRIERSTGARGLRSILEEVMLDVLDEVPDHAGKLAEYTVTPDVVRHRQFKKGKRVYRNEKDADKPKKDDGQRESA